MKFTGTETMLLFIAAVSCGTHSSDAKKLAAPPANDATPRWEVVDRPDLEFDYYVSNNETTFSYDEEYQDVVTVLPWLKLKGMQDESMEFVMMVEGASADRCKYYRENPSFSWSGLVLESLQENQYVLFFETDKVLESGKHQSIAHFMVSKTDNSACAKLTFYDIHLKGYINRFSVMDKSEMSQVVRKIVSTVRLK